MQRTPSDLIFRHRVRNGREKPSSAIAEAEEEEEEKDEEDEEEEEEEEASVKTLILLVSHLSALFQIFWFHTRPVPNRTRLEN
jgi:uncharacterized protein YqhQ